MNYSLSLVASLALAVPAIAQQVIFSEVMYHPPGNSTPEFVEVQNLSSNRLDMAKWRLKGGVDYTFPDFNVGAPSGHFLKEFERILLSSADEATTRAAYPKLPSFVRVYGPWTGSLNNAGDSLRLEDAAGAKLCTLDFGDGGKWPVAADGAGHTLVVVNPNRAIDDWRNWTKSNQQGGTPGSAEVTAAEEPVANPEVAVGGTTTIVDFNGNTGAANPTDTKWKFYNLVAAPAANWNTPGFNDSTWGPTDPNLGYAPLGTETAAAPFPGIRTPVAQTSGLMAYYFRTTFSWTGPLTGNSFTIDQYIDDGVVLYLNGQEISRDRMPSAIVNHSTAANDGAAAPDATYEVGRMTGGTSSLNGKITSGTNTLAAEVHQNATGSSDHIFAIRMRITSISPGGVQINEVKPGGPGTGFVEFYNPTGSAVDLNGYYLTDAPANLTKYKITTSVVVPPSGLATVGFAESSLTAASPMVIYLTQPDGVTRQSAVSSLALSTDGRSLGRKPDGGGDWFLFASPTPGTANQSASFSTTLRLSEAHFDAAGHVDWVEFGNISSSAVSGAGYFVASQPDFTDKVPLPNTVPGSGFATALVDFTPAASGDLLLYLIDAGNNILETAELTHRTGLDSIQRHPLSSREWYNAATATQNSANAPALHDEIVISEIMAAPPSRHEEGQFVEIYNRGADPVDLSGWRFTDGLSYDFPSGTTLAAGAYLVVAKNPAYISANYSGVSALGPAGGSLRRSGEMLRLEDERRNLADSVDYKSGGQWPGVSGGEGSSLELIHPDMDNSQPSAWRASDESAKAPFASYSFTGVYRELRGQPTVTTACKELMLNLVSDAHVVLKNIKLVKSTAPTTNLIPNGDATSHGTGTGVNGWLCLGTHCLSDTLPDGLHLISAGSGDTKANKAEVDVTGINANDTLTLTFDARWISGMPLLVAQTWDRSFGKVFRFPIPNNLGTPGAANSRAIAAAAPTVDDMLHSPPVPTSTQPVVVTAKVSSVSPLTTVSLRERVDTAAGNGAWNTLAMNDSGTGGDAVAGDGIYSATVPARADGTITQFYITATAANGRATDCPRDPTGVIAVNGTTLGVANRPGMWIVDNTPPDSTPGILTERFVISLYHRAALATATGFSAAYDWDHPRMSNFGFNSTIIYNEKDICYNGELRRGGSPWTRTGANTLDRARWKPPGDNVFRNRSKSGVDNDPTNAATGPSRFHNRTVRYMLYLFGYPVPDSEFVQQIVNADAPRLGDDQEQTDSDFFDRAYDNGSDLGELFEIDDAWFMYDTNNMDDRLDAGSVTGRWSIMDWNNVTPAYPSAESPIFYHGNWPIRFPEERYDYAALSSLIKTSVTSMAADTYREQMERQIDFRRAAIYAAIRGYIGDWDNFTRDRGKNGYFYRRPTDGKFEFHHWDSDLGWQTGHYGSAILGSAGGTGWTTFCNQPYFRRLLYYYLSELLQKYTKNSPRMNAYLDANNYQNGNPSSLAPFTLRATSLFSTSDADVASRGQEVYTTWFNRREATAINQINSFGGVNYTRAFTIATTNNQTVTTVLFTLNGEAPSNVFRVEVLNHPEAVFTWTGNAANLGLWSLSSIALSNGLNSLTVRTLAEDGTVLATLPFAVTLNGNGLPIISLTSDPASRNVAANEEIVFDATGSFDPEGTALNFTWSVNPGSGAILNHSVPGKTEAKFLIPGLYTLTLTLTDAALNSASTSRDITVYNTNDFAPFGNGLPLGPEFTVQNLEFRDNFSPSTWYSVEDVTGRLHIQVLDDVARPLSSPSFTHPLVTRDLPDSTDFVLQTDFEPDTREFGDWQSGLWLEMTEGASTVRYAFSLDGGTNVYVRRAVQPNVFSNLFSTSATGTGATLRVRRTGNSLIFQRLVGAAWSTVFTQSLPAGATASIGGIFVSTSNPTTVRMSFDYLTVADPSNTNNVLANLRITEVHYNPTPGGVEFIELRNVGSQAIDLSGVHFDIGSPFAMAGVPTTAYTFGAESLAPGEFIVIPENTATFQALYGNAIRLAAAWTSGNLSNGGERIFLLDSSGNTIHDFSYDDDPPWPTAADGAGPSLEVVDINGDYNSASNWRASFELNGTPGFIGVGPDTDGDGVPDSLEALFGTNPNDVGSVPKAASTINQAGEITLTWPSIPTGTYRVEFSSDLVNWSVLATVDGAGIYTDLAAPSQVRRYYRITAVGP